MHSTPFNIETDLPPIPFDQRVYEMAAQLKKSGLPWKPCAGCFVWDRDEHMDVPSPFPDRLYFILNLGRFLEIFGSLENIVKKLIWVPTWHQARLLCDRLGVDKVKISDLLFNEKHAGTDDVLHLYNILLKHLNKG